MKLADLGFARWVAKPHNARWHRKIDGTPIRNDLCVNIAETFVERLGPPAPDSQQTEGQGDAPREKGAEP